jgi:hypothetical protein
MMIVSIMQSLAWLKDYLQYVVAIVAAIAALMPLWSRSETSNLNRWVVAFFAAVVAILLWPSRFPQYCQHSRWYAAAAIALVVLAVIAYFGQLWLRHRFGESQITQSDADVKTRTIVGGPLLTPVALALKRKHPGWSTQEIFEALDCKPKRTWERKSRTRVVIADAVLEVLRGTATILALVATGAYLFSNHEVERLKRHLTITRSNNDPLLPGGSVAFTADVYGCDLEVQWRVEGPDGRAPGVVSSNTGIYSAPPHVDAPFDVYVTARWVSEGEELPKRETVHLLPTPDYTTPHIAEGVDDNKHTAKFVVQVVDQRYSWKYNDVTLDGQEKGQEFARLMAEDGLFNGYEDVICIGAASRQFVGSKEKESSRTNELAAKQKEENRAAERAALLSEWVRNAANPRRVRIHGLKIGRYNDDTWLPADVTKNERQVVIVGVSHPGRTVQLLPALRDAFGKLRDEQPILGKYLDHYPLKQWELTPPD